MAPSRIRKALGAVKDQTTIGLAKVGSSSASSTELEVAIVKATRHDELPAEEKHVREILSLTCYSRQHVTACVGTISRRLSKTRSWAVALKSLVLVHRLLLEGDPAYEQELFFATRRGTRLLNLSDFRDGRGRDAWDFSAFVRTFALYLDERMEYRMQGRKDGGRPSARRRRRSEAHLVMAPPDVEEDNGPHEDEKGASSAAGRTPVREMATEKIFAKTAHLQSLLERFLACRPTGAAKNNRIVAVALYPLVKESFQLYYDLVEIMGILVDRFMELEVPCCVKVHDVFTRMSKHFEDLHAFYNWCRTAGIARASDYPEVERITQNKLDVMDHFIRDRSALATRTKHYQPRVDDYDDMNAVKALPAPPDPDAAAVVVHVQEDPEPNQPEPEPEPEPAPTVLKEEVVQEEADFLNLSDDAVTGEEHENNLALALFDAGATSSSEPPPKWEAFTDGFAADWETALVESASGLAHQKLSLGGGFDALVLDGMYQHQPPPAAASLASGSASSVAFPVAGRGMLALPAPPVAASGGGACGGDPFAASLAVAPPPYVQMSEMGRKQELLVQEQAMWQQYAKGGMQGQVGLQQQFHQVNSYQFQQQRF